MSEGSEGGRVVGREGGAAGTPHTHNCNRARCGCKRQRRLHHEPWLQRRSGWCALRQTAPRRSVPQRTGTAACCPVESAAHRPSCLGLCAGRRACMSMRGVWRGGGGKQLAVEAGGSGRGTRGNAAQERTYNPPFDGQGPQNGTRVLPIRVGRELVGENEHGGG